MMAATAAFAADPVDRSDLYDGVSYQALAKFRHHIRAFFAFSDAALHDAHLMPVQYQAMLAIKAQAVQGKKATASSLADELFIRLNTAVELIDRLEIAGFVVRTRSRTDRRIVELCLSDMGSEVLAPLAAIHLAHHRAHMAKLLIAMNELAASAIAS